MPAVLAFLGLLGAFSILPPYLDPLNVDSSVEVVDHVVPGVIIAASSATSVLLLRAGRQLDSLLLLVAVALCVLAALWETTSHVPLVLDAGQPETPWRAVLLHSLPGPAILVLSVFLLARLLSVEPAAGTEARDAAR